MEIDAELGLTRVIVFNRLEISQPGLFLLCSGQKPTAKNGTPDRIRTYDLRLRRALLYPAELRVHVEPAEQF